MEKKFKVHGIKEHLSMFTRALGGVELQVLLTNLDHHLSNGWGCVMKPPGMDVKPLMVLCFFVTRRKFRTNLRDIRRLL